MSPEQFAGILLALAAVFGAVARCIHEVREYHKAVNSKMDALLQLTAVSSRAEGALAERRTRRGSPDASGDPRKLLPPGTGPDDS